MRTLIAILAAGASLAGIAAAQDAPPAKFTTDEAAGCGAVFASLVRAFQEADNVPEETRTGATVGLMFWEYELSASAPNDEPKVQKTVLAAFDALAERMPEGETPEAANARGDFLMNQAKACSDRIDAAYPDADHPVAAQLRQVAAEQGVPEEAKKKPNRLR